MNFDDIKSLIRTAEIGPPLPPGLSTTSTYGGTSAIVTPSQSLGVASKPVNAPEENNPNTSKQTSSGSSAGTGATSPEKTKSETGVKSMAEIIMETAARMGSQAQAEAKKIAERDVLLSQLFTKYGGNEQDVIDFINKALFEVQLSHDELIALVQVTNQAATSSGQSLKSVNDFALEHIKKIQNPELTKSLVQEAGKLKSMFRNIPVFEILANDFNPGSYPEAEQYTDNPLMFGKDPDNFLLFQELRGMVVQRNAEQVELLRREFESKLRQKQKAIEVANRKRDIVEMMESIEYLDAETAAVNKISEIFQASVLNPNVKMFRRLFRDLKAAQVLKDEFMAGIQFQSTQIPYEELRKSQPDQPRIPSMRGSESQNNIVIAQAVTQQNPLAIPTNVPQKPVVPVEPRVDKAKADATFNKNKNLINRMLVNQITDAQKALQATSKAPQMAGITASLTRLINQLGNIRASLATMDSLTFTNKFFPIINQTGIDLKLESDKLAAIKAKSASSNKFVKVAAPPFPTPATSGPNIATYNPSADPWVEGGLVVLAGAGFLGTLAAGDLAGAAGIAAAAWLLYQQNMAAKVRTIVGRPLPKNLLTPEQVKRSQEAYTSILNSSSEAQTLITFSQYRENAKAVILSLESTLMSRIEGEVAKGKTSSSIASAPPDQMKKDFKEFMNFLNNATRVVQAENNFIDTLRQKALNKTIRINPLLSPTLLQLKSTVQQDLRTFFLEKKRKYSSFALVVDNYVRSARLMAFIRRELPFLTNYMNASGTSVADMVLGGVGQPSGGIIGALDVALDVSKNNVERLQAEIFKKDPKAFKNFYGDNVANFRSPSMSLDNPVTPTPRLPITEIPRPATASNIFENLRFSNMIVESQTAPVTPVAPSAPTTQNQLPNTQLDKKANDKLTNLLTELNYTYDQIRLKIPYVDLQNDPINMRVMQGKIQSIPDENLRKLVNDKLMKKLEENKSLAAQVKTDQAKEMIEQQGLEEFYKLISNSPGILADVSPTKETQGLDDEVDVASLMEQYNGALADVAKIEGIRMQLLRNPSDLGALSSFVGARSSNRFVKIAKTEDPKEEVFEYWDKLLPGYGDILEDPEEHLDQTVQEVEEEQKKKNPNHNK